MTFKDVAVKNFKVNIKKYLMCFLCSSFSIMILFMYSTLLFNDSIINTGNENMGLDFLLYTSMGAISLFSIFFINYANRAFLKSRYKEFGVMMTLGMNKKDIIKLIFLENIFIIISSLVIGIITGAIFSRLFQMVVKEILHLDNIKYVMNYKSFLLTIVVFVMIFLVQLVITILSTNRFTIEELIKKDRVNEGRLKWDILPGVIGLVIMLSSIISLLFIGNNESLRSNLIIVLPIIALIYIGVYITISSLGMTLMALIKSIPKSFNRNIIVVTNINQKFTTHKKVIFILTMLTSLTVFAIAPPLSLLNELVSVVDLNKYDIEFVQVYGLNEVDEKEVQEISSKYNIEIKEELKTEFILLKFSTDNGGVDITSTKPILSESEYNLVSSYKADVLEGEALAFVTGWLPDNGGVEEGIGITLENIDLKEEFNIREVVRNHWISNDLVFPAKSAIVLDDRDYYRLKKSTNEGEIGYLYHWDLSNWINKDEFSNEIKRSLINEPKEGGEEYTSLSDKYLFYAKPLLYNSMKQGYRFFIFITTILGILFFIASASVLFFNQYIELEESKKKFKKLYKIGITKKERSSIISKELFVTFFTPVILGSLVAGVLMNYTAKIMGGSAMINEFTRSSLKVILVYLVFQVIFYLFTRRNYINKIEN